MVRRIKDIQYTHIRRLSLSVIFKKYIFFFVQLIAGFNCIYGSVKGIGKSHIIRFCSRRRTEY